MAGKTKTSVTVYFRIDLEFYKEMEEIRMKLGQTKTQFVMDAVRKHIEQLKKEDVIDKLYNVRREN